MHPRTIDSYGGVFFDASPVAVPDQEQAADFANRLNEDAAQGSRTSTAAWCTFETTTTSGPVACAVSDGRNHSGSSSGAFPTVTKTATGLYTIAYPSNFEDGLGETEERGFLTAWGEVWGATFGKVQPITVSGGTITIEVFNSSAAASDLGGSASITVFAI